MKESIALFVLSLLFAVLCWRSMKETRTLLHIQKEKPYVLSSDQKFHKQ